MLTFDSPLWENAVLLNAGNFNPSDEIDAKYAGFVSTPAAQIRACGGRFEAVGVAGAAPGGNGCISYTLPAALQPTVLSTLFATTPKSSTANILFDPDPSLQWLGIFGLSAEGLPGYQGSGFGGCNPDVFGFWGLNYFATGINLVDDWGCADLCNAKVRFGLLTNNEGNVATANNAAGFGIQASAGTTRLGSGNVWFDSTPTPPSDNSTGAVMYPSSTNIQCYLLDQGAGVAGSIWVKARSG